MKVKPFVEYIEQKAGIYLDSSYEFKLQNAVTRRIAATKSDNEKAYLDFVEQNPEEFNNLINLITVNETYFQREPKHIETLAEKIAPKLLETLPASKSVRIVSAGCSSGEEIYSLVMTLRDKFGDLINERFEFLGFDIDSEALEKAKAGVYGRSSFRSISPEFLKRYFEDLANREKRISSEIRERVRFVQNNIVNSLYPVELLNVDVIFYRNTSIYFKPDTQKAIFKKLAGLLNEPGHLFLSSTETFAHDFGVLPLVDIDGAFFFSSDPDFLKESAKKSRANPRKKSAEKKKNDNILKFEFKPTETNGKAKKKTSGETLERICNLVKNGKYYDALKILDGIDESDDRHGNNIAVARAKISIDLGQYDKAREICLEIIKKDQWLLWPHLLLGYLAMQRGDKDEQLERFKKAVYILPTCWLAHYGLLKYYILKSDTQNMRKKTKITIRLLEKDSSDWFNPGFVPKFIDRKTILSECHNLLTRH